MLSAASPVKLRKSSRLSPETKEEVENVSKKSKTEFIRVTRSKLSKETSIETPIKQSSKIPIKKSPIKKDDLAAKKSPIKMSVQKSDDFDCFGVAKRAFHRSGAFKIVGRVEEKAELTSFWYDHVTSRKGASIYISGNPGTGKTALVDELIPELIKESTFTSKINLIKINCMMLKDPLKSFQEISQNLNVKTDKNVFITVNNLETFFCEESEKVFHVIIIDEVDQISMKDPELLCKLLAMPYLPNSRLIVIGIANSMDLTERFLPRLKLLNCEPNVLHFPQYTVPDIVAILCDRLERINTATGEIGRPFMDKSAIELTSRKVASTGDLRRALDMLRQAIDLAEDEYKLTADKSTSTGALVKLSHVAKIMDKFGNSQSGPLVLLKSLNLHQKVILAAIVGFVPGATPLTIQKLYEEYCNGALRPPKLYDSVTRSEFIDLISNLESMSIIGKSTLTAITSSTNSESSNSSLMTDLWKLKVYLLVPNELVKTMISQELPTIKILFNIQ